MNIRTTLIGGLLTVVLTLGTLAMPVAARANEKGARLTTYGLSAASAYFFLSHQTGLGVLTGAGALVAGHEWQKGIDARHNREWWRHHYRHHRNRHHHRR